MTYDDIVENLHQMGVHVPDERRAALYYHYLEAAHTFFHTTMAANGVQGLGNNYEFVRRAVQSTALLKQLAEMLDFFIVHAVVKAANMNHETYQNYFTNHIFDANNVIYVNNRNAFYATFPIALNSMNRLSANFQNNIFEVCDRIINDRNLLTRFYEDKYDELSIDYLKSIRSTGSDFHKGGKQVVILTFGITYYRLYPGGALPKWTELQLVYKPNDMEIDCLISGDSAAVNRVIPNFNNAGSLAEIFNTRLRTLTGQLEGLEPLPTYRILPRNYMSQQNVLPGAQLPVRAAYGYIEFLNYDESGMDYGMKGFFPLGSSDYLIYKSQILSGAAKKIIRKFYREMGQWIAIACTFSLTDLHYENVRVRGYEPRLIDLEASLVDHIRGMGDTLLLNAGVAQSGITGKVAKAWEHTWAIEDENVINGIGVRKAYEPKYGENRLWTKPRGTYKVVKPDAYWLLQGFTNGMEVLKNGVANNSFNQWHARANNVLVRYLAYQTGDLKGIRDGVCLYLFETVNFGAQPLPFFQQRLQTGLEDGYNAYHTGLNQNPPLPDQPNFVALTANGVATDLMNLDIPTFYHRIGTADIVDSDGHQIQIPATIVVNGNNVNPNLGNNNRQTFFNGTPIERNVWNRQVVILGGQNSYTARVQLLTDSILEGLNLQVAPTEPGNII